MISYSKPPSTSSMYCALMPGRDEHDARAEQAARVRSTTVVVALSAVVALRATRWLEIRHRRSRSRLDVAAEWSAEVLAVADLAAERAVVDVHRDRLVEPSPVGVDLRATFLRPVVEQTDARREQLPVERHRVRAELLARSAGRSVFCRKPIGVTQPLLFVAQAGVERQVRLDLPGVADVRGRPVDRVASISVPGDLGTRTR